MRKLTIILTTLLFTIIFTSCKKETILKPNSKFSFETKTTTINWTAYKTTEKLPVKGTFTKVNATNISTSNTKKDAINGLAFSIPVNSIDTKNKDRDVKLITNFFGEMKETQNITGKVILNENGKGIVNLKMNGLTKELPISYIISGQLVNINATLNLNTWQAQTALKALNLACNEKHKGKDGISKTWSEVELNIVTYLKGE